MPSEAVTGEPIFPVEIFQLIIAELVNDPSDNKSSFESCSLVCKTFLPLCQPRLFRKIIIRPHGSLAKSCDRLADVLSYKPHLGSFVEEFTCILVGIDSGGVGEPPHDNNAPLSCDARGSMTLQECFPNVKYLTMVNESAREGFRNRTQCPISTPILSSFIPLSSITHISLHGLQTTPLSTILGFPNIQSLSLTSTLCSAWSNAELYNASRENWNKNLRSLYLDRVSNFPWWIVLSLGRLEELVWQNVDREGAPWPLSHIPKYILSYEWLKNVDIQDTRVLLSMCIAAEQQGIKAFVSLRTLRVRASPSGTSFRHLDIVFKHLRSLEEIAVSFDFVSWRVYRHLNLTPCFENCHQRLRNVEVSAIFGPQLSFIQYGDEVVRGLCEALQSVQGRNIIEVLRLKMKVKDIYDSVHQKQNPEIQQWKRFDSLLIGSRSICFPCLREVTIHLEIESPGDPYGAGPTSDCTAGWLGHEFWKDTLRRLSSTSEVDFKCQVTVINTTAFLDKM